MWRLHNINIFMHDSSKNLLKCCKVVQKWASRVTSGDKMCSLTPTEKNPKCLTFSRFSKNLLKCCKVVQKWASRVSKCVKMYQNVVPDDGGKKVYFWLFFWFKQILNLASLGFHLAALGVFLHYLPALFLKSSVFARDILIFCLCFLRMSRTKTPFLRKSAGR